MYRAWLTNMDLTATDVCTSTLAARYETVDLQTKVDPFVKTNIGPQ